MGADSLADLPNWREPGRICALASPIVVGRAGAAEPDYCVLAPLVAPERLADIRELHVEMPTIEFSSSEFAAASPPAKASATAPRAPWRSISKCKGCIASRIIRHLPGEFAAGIDARLRRDRTDVGVHASACRTHA